MKRMISLILALGMMLTCFCGTAFAVNTPDMRASLTIYSYNVTLKAGDSRGAIKIAYSVGSSKAADSVGVESIAIYKSDGTPVVTISGSTSNGLIRSDSSINKGDYSYTLTSGVSYYAVVTVFARAGSEYDSREVTTSTVKAP